MKPDQERVKNLLADTVTLLCKNGLNFHKELRVQGLIGITLDDDDVFIVHINERLTSSDEIAAVRDTDKENSGKPSTSASCGEKLSALSQNSGTESCEKLLHNSVMFSMPGSGGEPSDLATSPDVSCAIVKIEKVENTALTEPAVQAVPYDKMVDFASFLPDFSSARYATDLSALHQSNLSLPGLPSGTDVSRCSKRKRDSGLPPEKFLPKSSGGDCLDAGLLSESSLPGNLPIMSFHGSQGRVHRSCASSIGKSSDLLLDQNATDVAAGLMDDYSRARATASYFEVGVECNAPSAQGFDSQQLLSYRWKRRSQHSLEKPFHCTVPGCSRSYWNMPDLYRHRKMNHGICGRAQARKKAELDLQNSRLQ